MHENDDDRSGMTTGAGVAGCADAADAQVIDRSALDRLAELDPDGRQGLVQRVLQTFAKSLGQHLQDFAAARAGADVAQLARLAHTLKSSAAVGAQALSRTCAAIEHDARVDQGMPRDEALDAFMAQARAVQRAVAAMLDA